MSNYMKEINKCLSEHKDEILEIENAKTEKSKKLSHNDLEFLWTYYMNAIGVCGFLSCFDLTRREYTYCTYKIFGIKSAKVFLKYSKKDEDKWNNKTRRRLATEIVLTYRRRGQHFLRNSLSPKNPTYFQKRYLNLYGFLKKDGKVLAQAILDKLKGGRGMY